MRRAISSISIAAFLLASGCCSSDKEHRDGVVTGGILGAGAGALIGSMTGSWVWGGIIGGGMGALAGYVVADQSQERRKGAAGREAVVEGDRLQAAADREFRIAMEARDPGSAEFHLKESIKLHPTAAAHNNLGLLQLNAGNRDAARASFREAIALDPRYEPALKNLENLGA